MTVALAGPAPGTARLRGAVLVLRVVSWAAPAVCVAVALAAHGGARWAVGAAGVAATAVALAYRRSFADYARAASRPTDGSVEITADHLIVRQAGVLAADIAIPWGVVRAVCVDEGSRSAARRAAATDPPRRFLVPEESAEVGAGRPVAVFGPGRRRQRGGGLPLLAATPVVPNVLVLLEPPVEVPWHYPFVAGPFTPPWGGAWPARPWPAPALTPGFLLAVTDPGALAASAATGTTVRDVNAADGRYLATGGLLD